ncbi:DUF2254 domain-containing protein [Actinoplanes sp. NPDC049668]|uniref:DUF2254 domain-containing protein n=1 Tax=unclassified Actinoplanes TaxID=2626549 RepID=UPI0033A27D7E
MTSWAVRFRIRQYLKGSLWVIPLFGALLGPIIGYVVWRLDGVLNLPESMRYSAATATGVLTAIVAAMIGLLGFVVTIGVLVVQMATGTLSPRFMRLWYRDRMQKVVLAGFVGTFTYAYSLLSRVEPNDVPNLGIFVAGVLTVGNLVLLLLYLDRFTHNLRPVAVAAAVARAGRQVIGTPGRDASSGDDLEVRPRGPAVVAVRARRSGVIQAIHVSRLTAVARRHGCHLVMTYGVGDFVPQNAPLIEVYGEDGASVAADRLLGWVAVGRERTIDQDPAFALRVLVDIAIRALSPAVNDPTTAVQTIDYTEELLRALAAAGRPAAGRLTVPTPGWTEYVALATTEIIQFGASSVQVCRRLRALLEDLHADVTAAQRETIDAQRRLLDLAVEQAWPDRAAREFARTADRQGIGGGSDGR